MRSFESEWYLRTHVEFHHDPNRYLQYCSICKIEFNNRWEEQKHKAKEHQQEFKEIPPTIRTDADPNFIIKTETLPRFTCVVDGCGMTFMKHD
jgi:hypothetical protein